jgi:hypothetical protein
MRFTAVPGLLAIMLFAACAPLAGAPAQAAEQTTSVSLNQPFTLKVGASASVGTGRVLVRFERVLKDSRCPADVQCIQAGEAVVQTRISRRGQEPETIDLSTNPRANTAEIGDNVLELTALDPVPLVSRQTRPEDFRATFVLTRK